MTSKVFLFENDHWLYCSDVTVEEQYLPNGIGGTDELFFGFKDERDYIMFTLRWA